ncbi:MAG: hypothetical protein KF757_01590 [Phycisphaeraceae bacterium]|nr:hypothetical protein [Phycisphaeraceae bacterium]MCW5761903.1 hypothetical protein [Phycisphaeraceae bacterium]
MSGTFDGTFSVVSIGVHTSGIGVNEPGFFIGEGDLSGDVAINWFLEGEISIPGDVPDGSAIWLTRLPVDGTILIGGQLDGLIYVSHPDEEREFAGQIIINSNAVSDPDREMWVGEVKIWDPIEEELLTLSPQESQPDLAPKYNRTSVQFGGGAIGLVPFDFHPIDSLPHHNSVVTGPEPETVIIHHYGPIIEDDDEDPDTYPVRVYQSPVQLPCCTYTHHRDIPVCNTAIWTDVTDGFLISVSGREVTIESDANTFHRGYVYQFVPEALLCDKVPGNPQVAWHSNWAGTRTGTTHTCTSLPYSNGYGFVIPTAMDLNFNLMHDTGALELWLLDPVDVNDDDVIDFLDAAAIIDAIAEQE